MRDPSRSARPGGAAGTPSHRGRAPRRRPASGPPARRLGPDRACRRADPAAPGAGVGTPVNRLHSSSKAGLARRVGCHPLPDRSRGESAHLHGTDPGQLPEGVRQPQSTGDHSPALPARTGSRNSRTAARREAISGQGSRSTAAIRS